ncbi:MAG: YggS family pyridoxal phosphate-dependent enzyme [Firmicutes bacterium]|nr:YggS family pyridoxal phosphate-dependent enzyme [Bacillota bacterium]
MSIISENVAKVKERMHQLRPEGGVKLMAVSKLRTRIEAEEAIAAGVDCLGENWVREAAEKWQNHPPIPLHMIGHLQTNKAKAALDVFDTVDSVDSEHLAHALNRRVADGKILSVMVELNIGEEPNKYGVSPRNLVKFLELGEQWPQLRFDGILTVLPKLVDESRQEIEKVRHLMKETAELWRICKSEGFPWAPLSELSMGMTADYEWALEAGSTQIRLGTILFGPRDYSSV